MPDGSAARLAYFGDAVFALSIVVEAIRRGHERPYLTEFELYRCTTQFLDLERTRQLKACKIFSNIFGVHTVHRNFHPTRLNRSIQVRNFTMARMLGHFRRAARA